MSMMHDGEFTITFGRDGEWTLSTPDDYTLADLPLLCAVTAAVESAAMTTESEPSH